MHKIATLLNSINKNILHGVGTPLIPAWTWISLKIIIPSGTNLLSAHCTTYLLFLSPLIARATTEDEECWDMLLVSASRILSISFPYKEQSKLSPTVENKQSRKWMFNQNSKLLAGTKDNKASAV